MNPLPVRYWSARCTRPTYRISTLSRSLCLPARNVLHPAQSSLCPALYGVGNGIGNSDISCTFLGVAIEILLHSVGSAPYLTLVVHTGTV